METIESKQRCQVVARRRDPVSGGWVGLIKGDGAYVLCTLAWRSERSRRPRWQHEPNHLLAVFPWTRDGDEPAAWEAGFRALLQRTLTGEVPS